MKNLYKYLIALAIGLLIVVAGSDYIGNLQELKKVKKELIEKDKLRDQENREATFRIETRDGVIEILKQDVKDKDSIAKLQHSSADQYKAKWEHLVKSGYPLAKTTKDSLNVCLNVSDEMFKEATSLRRVVTTQSVIIISQKKIIVSLEKNIEDFKIQLSNEKQSKEMWKTRAETLARNSKSEKTKSFLKGAAVGVVIGGILVLLAL